MATRRSIDFLGGISFADPKIKGVWGGGFGDKKQVFIEQVAL
jgi:hypothetical protein